MNTTARTAPQDAWSVDYLGRVLINGAERQGDWGRIAAVRLLVEHETWLHRTDFRRHVEADEDGYAWLDLTSIAEQVDDSGLTRASSSETAILRLACSLAGQIPPYVDEPPLFRKRWTLQAILRPLGHANAALAAEAVRYAALGPAGLSGPEVTR